MRIKTDYDDLPEVMTLPCEVPQNEGAKLLYSILMSDNVSGLLDLNKAELIKYIPEISDMIGYDQNNPHHYLDLWNHTLEALRYSKKNLEIRMCLLFHDISKPRCCVKKDGISHYPNHNQLSSEMAREILEKMNWSENFIKNVCDMIAVHDSYIDKTTAIEKTEFAKKLLQVQFCDTLAHNISMMYDKLQYIKNMITLIKKLDEEKK